MSKDNSYEIGIYDLIKGLEAELEKFQSEKKHFFVLKDFSMKISVIVTKAGKGGIKIIIGEAAAEYSKEYLTQIELSFHPVKDIYVKK